MPNGKKVLEIYQQLIADEDFRKFYYDFFLDRFVYSIEDLEKSENDKKRQKMIGALLEAFNLAFSYKDTFLSTIEIQKLANIINSEEGIANFRRINVDPGTKANWEVTPPNRIYLEIYSLLNNYYNVWSGMADVFEKEASFHINLMRIHPFEDGNKRVSRLLLNVNLMNAGYPPVVIMESETDMYYQYINNFDVKGFTEYLKQKSYEEAFNIIFLYKSYKNIPIKEEIEEYLIRQKNTRE